MEISLNNKISYYSKISLPTKGNVHIATGRSVFSIVYVQCPRYVLDLLKLPQVPGLSITSTHMAKQVHDIQVEIEQKFEETNSKYKAVVDKHRRLLTFEKGDDIMVFL